MNFERESKYRKLAEELIRELAEEEGEGSSSAFKDRFFTRKELSLRYGVAPLTAYRILKYIESRGLIACQRGRRAVILRNARLDSLRKPSAKQRIGIVCDEEVSVSPDWENPGRRRHPLFPGIRQWICAGLERRFREDGHDCKRIPQNQIWHENFEAFTGFVLLHSMEDGTLRDFVRLLQDQEIPWAALSSESPAPNTLCIPMRHAFALTSLFFMKHHLKRCLFLSSASIHPSREPFPPGDHRKMLESCLRPYACPVHSLLLPFPWEEIKPDIEEERGERKNTMDAKNRKEKKKKKKRTPLEALLQKNMRGKHDEKTGIVTDDPKLAALIWEYLEKQGKNCPADYLLLSYGATRGYLPAAVPSLNFQNGKLVDALIRILYRQFISKNCFDPGAFVAPVLEETGTRIADASF